MNVGLPGNDPHQKKPKNARQDMHNHFQASASERNINEVTHAGDPGITSPYPATMGKSDVMGEGMVWRWGEERESIFAILAQTLSVGTVLLG